MSKYKEKIQKVFKHPTSGNVDFKKLISALEHYGAIVEITKQNKAKVFLKDQEIAIPIPHNNVLTKDMVVEVRHFLEKAGLTPDTLE